MIITPEIGLNLIYSLTFWRKTRLNANNTSFLIKNNEFRSESIKTRENTHSLMDYLMLMHCVASNIVEVLRIGLKWI